MNNFELYDENTAPEGARSSLRQARNQFGLIPNMMATMAESPALVKTYGMIIGYFESTSFSDTEKQLVMLAASHENACGYSMAIHSHLAGMKKVSAEVIESLREGHPLQDRKLETLRKFVCSVVKNRGHVSEIEIENFLSVGYRREQILDVVVGVGMKTLSNYTNHIADIPLDTAFQAQAWFKSS